MSLFCILMQPLSYGQSSKLAKSSSLSSLNYQKLATTHDLNLAKWGPYAKNYAGISHIADLLSGLRFDLTIVISQNDHKSILPNVRFDAGYYPWQANSDLSGYCYRYELQFKDQLYADVHYQIKDSSTVQVAIQYVNNTAQYQMLNADLMSSVAYPENYPSLTIGSNPKNTWKNAVHYDSLHFAHPGAKDFLPDNGWLRAEIRNSQYIDGRAVGDDFGKDSGDIAYYHLPYPKNQTGARLAIAYQMKAGDTAAFRLKGMVNQKIVLSGTGHLNWKIITLQIPRNSAGRHSLQLESLVGDPVVFNGFLMMEGNSSAAREQRSIVQPMPSDFVKTQRPQIVPRKLIDSTGHRLLLKYKDLPIWYGICWQLNPNEGLEDGHGIANADKHNGFEPAIRVREYQNDELDIFYREKINDHVSRVLRGNGKGDFTAVRLKAVTLAPHEKKWVYATLLAGSKHVVEQPLKLSLDSLWSDGEKAGPRNILAAGKRYALGWQLLKATLMTNIVYPIYTQNSYIRHFTPGKWWNSIYTWDLGFIALGLNEINPALATACINTYTTAPGSQSPFVFHGSPVPTQQYAFFDLWNKTQSRQLLNYFYPRLKAYYYFLVGHGKGSTTAKFKSGILSTWSYFYNSGGWDDYPAQVALHQQHDENIIAPVITTAQMIRVAKMLRMAAGQLGKSKDVQMYETDINWLIGALQRYSWNNKSGYFSYVRHNGQGSPLGPFLYKDSTDYNEGLDGAYPLLAGICTPEQQKSLLDKIFSPKHMWTKAGIGVVDQSAPYYRTDGYWNGKVWMPHQWFMWKTMLDLGRGDLAYKIAQKALKVYEAEVEASYNCLEYFAPTTGRGGGWHQFSGLSSPVLNWFAAYYKIGTVTTGFEIWIQRQSFNVTYSSYNADLSFDDATSAHSRTMLICMAPNQSYTARFNGQVLAVRSPYKGLLEITLPASNQKGKLVVQSLRF